eukprot:TRINITY_DN6568_c0_g1_i4.p1 TRINITY_DN6568_c0_g1~~TRINITY_DN6568_c0_g1_i4.p1  ORF type:complete len:639 (-),score=124.51 TRINITY_DN6568_c0_g1_i4:96-2012(-)
MSHTVTIWLEYFMHDYHRELLLPENSYHMESLSQHLLTLLKIVKNEYYLGYLHLTLRNLFFRFRRHVFRTSQTNFTLDCCFELLSHSFELSESLSRGSLSLLYTMMKANYYENGEFLRMKLAWTVAVSKLTMEQIKTLPYICDNFLCYARTDSPPGIDWEVHVKDLMGRLYRISVFLMVLKQPLNTELMIDIKKELTDEFNHSIEFRVKYLNQLAEEHKSRGNWLQLGLCNVTIAGIISKFLKMKLKDDCPPFPLLFSSYSDIVPNMIYELPVRSGSTIELLSPNLSEIGYFTFLDEALTAFEKVQGYELALAVTKLLYDYNLSLGRYSQLGELGTKITNWGKKAATIIQAESRMFYNFYRVGFYGKRFGMEFNQKQYIYCVPPSERLGDLTARLLADYSLDLDYEIKTLPNKPIEELVLDSEGHYLQIISVDALPPQCLMHGFKKEFTTFEKQFGTREFGIQVPFNPDGGPPSDDVEKQWKIRTIFSIGRAFPATQSRFLVIETRTEIVEPIDSAIDLLSSRIDTIKKELGQIPPNTKTLQIVLQGSIMLQVNVGPIGICKVFLNKASEYDPKKIAKLRAVLEEFLKKCKFALAFNKSLLSEQPGGLDPQMQAHHNAMTEALDRVMAEAMHFISLNQ